MVLGFRNRSFLALASVSATALSAGVSAQSPTLIKDIETGGTVYVRPSSSPGTFSATTRHGALFTAHRDDTGVEVWRTDGTTEGTKLFADIERGYRHSYPTGEFLEMPNGDVLCTAETEGLGKELWIVRPTGPELVADIDPGERGSRPGGFVLVGNLVYFIANDGFVRGDLWVTDGTTSGTTRVLDVVPAPGHQLASAIYDLSTPTGTRLVFFEYASRQSWAVWTSDGTPAGTRLVFRQTSGPSGFVIPTAILDGRLVFRAPDPQHGTEPWVTDGTTAGTFRLADIAPGVGSSAPIRFPQARGVVVDDRAVFATVESGGIGIWSTDGTRAGTVRVADPSRIDGRDPVLLGILPNDDVILSTWDPNPPKHQNLYRLRGPDERVELVASLPTGVRSSDYPEAGARLGDAIYFAGTGTEGTELWRTDGTTAGTRLVADLAPGTAGSNLRGLTAAGDRIVFSADNGRNVRDLWTSDGTAVGTFPIPLAEPAINVGSGPRLIGALHGKTYWGVHGGASPHTLWESDGTSSGTREVLNPGAFYSTQLTGYAELDDAFVFISYTHTNGWEPWISDGTGPGTREILDLRPGRDSSVPSGITALDGRAFFAAHDGVHGSELWVTDGTAAGTNLVLDVRPGADGSEPANLFAWNGQLFFVADDGVHFRELWVTDGTAAGTRLVKDIGQRGWGFGSPQFGDDAPVFIGLGDYVYFAADDRQNGVELWRSDGTEAGTTMVRDLWPWAWTSSSPRGFAKLGDDRMVFVARNAVGTALWVSDGSNAGTMPLRQVPGAVLSNLVPVDDATAVFFVQVDLQAVELWATDGTPTGSNPIATINATGIDWTQARFGDAGATRLLFNANDGVHGNELWITDGTANGTRVLYDLSLAGSNPRDIVRAGNRVVFSADDGVVGWELHAIDVVDDADDWVAAEHGRGCAGSNGSVPSIDAAGTVRVSAPLSPSITLAAAAPNAPTILVAGAGQTWLPVPGCALTAAPILGVPTSTDGSGAAAVQLALGPALVGAVASFQFATFDPGGAAFGQLSTTPGLEIVVGR